MRVIATVLAAIALAPVSLANDSGVENVSATFTEATVLVSWDVVPGTEYVVYGVDDGVPTELSMTFANSAFVPKGHEKYAVSVRDSGLLSFAEDCLYTDLSNMPPVYIGDC